MHATVIGAGPAGLAAAACLVREGIETRILEQAADVGSSWRNHYGRLHLHTARGRSGLPGLAMPARYGRYPSRADMVEYLETYAAHFGLEPRFGVTVETVRPDPDGWIVQHSEGTDNSDAVVFATGLNGMPFRAPLPGLDDFTGTVLHSSDYHAPGRMASQRVLVVGFGNSGGEIALDLAEAGARVTLSVRGPVNILPKEIFGVPITSMGLLRKILPYRVADAITAPVLRAKIGRPEDYGLKSAGKGPAAQVIEDGRIPLIDIGTLSAIRDGAITVRPGIDRIDGGTVHFVNGTAEPVDVILLATGYRVDLRAVLPETPEVLDRGGKPLVSGAETDAPGLYFCSYHASAEGQLRQSGLEAEAIARRVRKSAT
ncbi:NAD(P)/FAD-dependent oxidoreductase [Seohaeicola saemankumensis]|nr:NAD(P)/FAD-dependent oxidoreductase [Seohaeicola saemankumensis]MCA0871272.1 NAD(P)/FAD-dependent oxidoreductase [Seohaeicola saemankumensis]